VLRDIASRFLLASLSLETILAEVTIHRRRERLGKMKEELDLGGAYEPAILAIKHQDGERAKLGMDVLMWITHSRRSLHVDEICHAIAIQIGSNDLDNDRSLRYRPC